ncbi:Uncharacterised protein [uncultured archaeon]|nr:Uncharacterised protein [uncultured archaeon]
MAIKPFIPLGSKYMGKSLPEWGKVKIKPKPEPKPISAPKSFGNVVPLTDSNNKILELGAWEAIDECIKQGKRPATLKDADQYVLNNGGYYWTGGLIAYSKDKDTKLGEEFVYTDSNNNQKYLLQVPIPFQNLMGDHALILFFNYFQSKTPYFQCIDSTFNNQPIKEIIINIPNALMTQGDLFSIKINRKDGYYLTDSNLLIPNGDKADSSDKDARYFWQVINGPYLGLFRRGVVDADLLSVGAVGWPSSCREVLVYEQKAVV